MSQQRADSNDGIVAFIIGVFLIAGIGWGIWYFWHAELSNMLRYIRVYEMKLSALWLDEYDYTLVIKGRQQNLGQWLTSMPTWSNAQVDDPYVIYVANR